MALSRTARPRAAALVVAAVTSGTVLAGAGVPAGARAAAAAPPAPTRAAASTLISVTITAIPALSVNAFQGTYATSTVPQNGGDGSADGTDPHGVLDRITLVQPAQSKTHSDPAKNWADAVPAVEYSLHGKKLYSITSVDAHAECAPSSPGATTYVHTSSDSVNVLGKSIASGKTTVPVTGAQLGSTAVDHGSLDVTYFTATTQEQQTSAVSVRAHLDLTITGTLYDSSGKQLYSGPVQKLRLGDVQVACQSSATTPSSSAPSSAAPPAMPSSGSPSTTVESSPTAAGGANPPAVLQQQQPQQAQAQEQAHHAGKPRQNTGNKPESSAPQAAPMMPAAKAAKSTSGSGGGGAPLWWVLVSVLALGSGTALFFATRRRGRHQ